MCTTAVGTWIRAKVRGGRPYPKAAFRQGIFDIDFQRKWIAWLWIEHVFHHGSMWLLFRYGPGRPADEAVDCITTLWLVQRELVAPSVKFVAAILQSIWPGDQYLTTTRGAHLVGLVSIDKLPAARSVRAKASTNPDDHSLLISSRDRDLLTRWGDHCCLSSRFFCYPPLTRHKESLQARLPNPLGLFMDQCRSTKIQIPNCILQHGTQPIEFLIDSFLKAEPFHTKSIDTSSNQTAPLATVIRHDLLWKCRPPTRSEGALNSSEGCWGWGVDEIGIALS
jgi:hypothetical protein